MQEQLHLIKSYNFGLLNQSGITDNQPNVLQAIITYREPTIRTTTSRLSLMRDDREDQKCKNEKYK